MAAFHSAISNEDILSSLGHRRPWASTTFVGNHLPIPTQPPTHTHGSPLPALLHLGREPSLIAFSFVATKVLSGLLVFSLLDSRKDDLKNAAVVGGGEGGLQSQESE